MLELSGIQLDSHHILAECEDKDGEKYWCLFKFKKKIVDCNPNDSIESSLWEMKIIDPNNFKWNGQEVCLIKDQFYKKEEFNLISKKIVGLLAAAILSACALTGCDETDASQISYSLSHEADHFNVVRELTVINCITGDILFQMSGKMSITADTADNQLEIIVEDNENYIKHFVGLSDNVTYVIEDLNLNEKEISEYRYVLNYNPKMWSNDELG